MPNLLDIDSKQLHFDSEYISKYTEESKEIDTNDTQISNSPIDDVTSIIIESLKQQLQQQSHAITQLQQQHTQQLQSVEQQYKQLLEQKQNQIFELNLTVGELRQKSAMQSGNNRNYTVAKRW